MKDIESIPFAPSLIESMRSLGYSFESAVADIIDNSISANAKRIEIDFESKPKPYLMIFDDGCGMNEQELFEAMRYGSKNPLEKRHKDDLGRFGLGLKSASLSQCRELVVVSKKNRKINCYSWDLDYVIKNQSWKLKILDLDEIENKEKIEEYFANKKSGTCVIWKQFDRVLLTTKNIETTFVRLVTNTINHLELVFHRYIEDGLIITVNNSKLKKIDPFLKSHKKTKRLREKKLTVDDSKILVRPFVLPHKSNLSNDDLEKLGGKERLNNGQGFYIYRNKRLIISGTWFRIANKEELNKLARVMVDIPNTLDYMWNIDVKKNTALLPDSIKNQLYSAVNESVTNSKTKNVYRGRKVKSKDISHVWEKFKERSKYKYMINRELPQIKVLEANLDDVLLKQLQSLIELLENTLPTESIYIDSCQDLITINDLDDEKMCNDVRELYNMMKNNYGVDSKSILEPLLIMEPYRNSEKVIKLIKELLEQDG